MQVEFVKVEVLLPEIIIEKLRDELNSAGFLTVGNYDHVLSYSHVKGYWRPLDNSIPYKGKKGIVSFGEECKMEFRCKYKDIKRVISIIRSIHPYEEPIINVMPLIN